MKGVLLKIGGLVLAITVVVASLGAVFAQENADQADVDPMAGILSVRVNPTVAQVGEEVSFHVVERNDNAPVSGAYLYALTWPNDEPDVTSAAESGVIPDGYKCEFIGRTDGSGKADYEFSIQGRRLIVATLDGYGPGIAKLIVKQNVVDKLKIRAPRCSIIDESVIMQVINARTSEPVGEAHMWAVPLTTTCSGDTSEKMSVREIMEEIRNATNEDMESILCDWYIGQTTGDGTIEHIFSCAGKYVLVSAKDSYVPAYRFISIVDDYALTIVSPKRADIGDNVTFTVKVRCLGTPVEGVELYGLNLNNATDTAIQEGNLKDIQSRIDEISEIVTGDGFYMGSTNENGQCMYQFTEQGRYLVVGVEEGYTPAITYISIGQLPTIKDRLNSIKRLLPENISIEGMILQRGECDDMIPRMKTYGQKIRKHVPENSEFISPRSCNHELLPTIEMSLDVY